MTRAQRIGRQEKHSDYLPQRREGWMVEIRNLASLRLCVKYLLLIARCKQ